MLKDPKKTHPVDLYVGNRLKVLRKKHQLSQTKLADMMGLSHQQIQQYEQGINRISASTLYEFAEILHVSVQYFYEGFSNYNYDSVARTETICTKREHSLNILLIEDDAADELLTREALEGCGCATNLHVVHDGIEALEFLRNKKQINSFPRPDIVLLDLNIPGKDGHSVLKEIKRDPQIRDIPVIILTNSINTEEMIEAYKHYASGFIVKAFDIDEFNKCFATIVNYWSSIVLPSMQYNSEAEAAA